METVECRYSVNTVEIVVTVKTAKTEDLKKYQLLTCSLTDNLKTRDASASKNLVFDTSCSPLFSTLAFYLYCETNMMRQLLALTFDHS